MNPLPYPTQSKHCPSLLEFLESWGAGKGADQCHTERPASCPGLDVCQPTLAFSGSVWEPEPFGCMCALGTLVLSCRSVASLWDQCVAKWLISPAACPTDCSYTSQVRARGAWEESGRSSQRPNGTCVPVPSLLTLHLQRPLGARYGGEGSSWH